MLALLRGSYVQRGDDGFVHTRENPGGKCSAVSRESEPDRRSHSLRHFSKPTTENLKLDLIFISNE